MKTLKTLIVLALVYLMAVFPAMADLTVDNKVNISLGNKRMMVAEVDFDSSYAFGGESFDYTSYGFNHVDTVKFIDKMGYTFEYDYTNKKVKVFSPAPPIVYEEKHTIPATPFQVTLNYPAAFVMNVASATANYSMLSGDSTAGSGEVAVELTEGTPGTRAVLTFNTAQAAQVIYVTYVTQAWKEVFDNLVVDESHDFTTTGTALSYSPVAIMYMDQGGTPLKPIYSSDTAAAGEVNVAWASATLTAQANSAGGKVAYIKMPSSGFLADRFVEEELVTMSSGAGATTWPVLIWGLAGFIVDAGAAEAVPDDLMLAGDALGTAGESYIDWFRTKTLLGAPINSQGTSTTGKAATYIKGIPSEIPHLVPLEVKNGLSLSGLTNVKVEIIGN